MSGSRAARRQRMVAARRDLSTLQEELSFERISIMTTDSKDKWIFHYESQILLEYWPAHSLSRTQGEDKRRCGSAAQAKRFAMMAKKRYCDVLLSFSHESSPFQEVPLEESRHPSEL